MINLSSRWVQQQIWTSYPRNWTRKKRHNAWMNVRLVGHFAGKRRLEHGQCGSRNWFTRSAPTKVRNDRLCTIPVRRNVHLSSIIIGTLVKKNQLFSGEDMALIVFTCAHVAGQRKGVTISTWYPIRPFCDPHNGWRFNNVAIVQRQMSGRTSVFRPSQPGSLWFFSETSIAIKI